MTYSGPGVPVFPMVSCYTHGEVNYAVAAAAPASAAWEMDNRAVYVPVILPGRCIVRRVWWANGATTTGGATVEVGVYADMGASPGAKLVSGSATQGTASQVQFVDVTDTTIGPGRYWIAIAASTATNTTFFRSSFGAAYDAAFRVQESSALPLPATATPVESSTAYTYLCGFATTASP